MLQRREMITTLSGETLKASVSKGFLQGGVLSPLLSRLVMDGFLWELTNDGNYMVGYANDTAILINGKLPQTVSQVLYTSLCTVQRWFAKTNLSINLNKMVVISFRRKRNLRGCKEPTLFYKKSSLQMKSNTLN
jgi:hypothetical protein